MRYSPRTMLVRFVAIAAAVATTITHVHACCCVPGEALTKGLEKAPCEACPCNADLDELQTVLSSSTAGVCSHLGFDATGCCEEGICESCGCEAGPQPTEAVVSESTFSIDDIAASYAYLGSPATVHHRQESCADWQLARGSPHSATPQSLFCVWIN